MIFLASGLPEEFKGRRRKGFGQKDDDASSQYEEKEKIVLEGILFINHDFPWHNQALGHLLNSETCM
jgi:hypothetical protein